MLVLHRLFFAAALILCLQTAAAQQGGSKPAHAKPGAGNAQQMTISAVTLTLMIKGVVIALHQANMTGNYSVLRDMGTPIFREKFDQASLTEAFSDLRARKVDLSPALLVAPNLTKNPEFNKDGELVLVGDFPTQPLQIHFEIMFVPLDGIWRLAGLGVDAVPPQAVQAAAPPQQTAPAPQQSAQPSAPASKKQPTKPKS